MRRLVRQPKVQRVDMDKGALIQRQAGFGRAVVGTVLRSFASIVVLPVV